MPTLPGAHLGIDQSVPVAYWIGPTTAAVLHIRCVRELVDEQVVDGETEEFTDADIDLFCLIDGTWEEAGGGGGGWRENLPLDDQPFTVRVLNSEDVPLAEVEEPAGFEV